MRSCQSSPPASTGHSLLVDHKRKESADAGEIPEVTQLVAIVGVESGRWAAELPAFGQELASTLNSLPWCAEDVDGKYVLYGFAVIRSWAQAKDVPVHSCQPGDRLRRPMLAALRKRMWRTEHAVLFQHDASISMSLDIPLPLHGIEEQTANVLWKQCAQSPLRSFVHACRSIHSVNGTMDKQELLRKHGPVKVWTLDKAVARAFCCGAISTDYSSVRLRNSRDTSLQTLQLPGQPSTTLIHRVMMHRRLHCVPTPQHSEPCTKSRIAYRSTGLPNHNKPHDTIPDHTMPHRSEATKTHESAPIQYTSHHAIPPQYGAIGDQAIPHQSTSHRMNHITLNRATPHRTTPHHNTLLDTTPQRTPLQTTPSQASPHHTTPDTPAQPTDTTPNQTKTQQPQSHHIHTTIPHIIGICLKRFHPDVLIQDAIVSSDLKSTAVNMDEHLAASASLHEMLAEDTVETAPPAEAEPSGVKKTTRRMARVRIDIAAMQGWRVLYRTLGPFYRYLAIDASPQVKQSYEVLSTTEVVIRRTHVCGKSFPDVDSGIHPSSLQGYP